MARLIVFVLMVGFTPMPAFAQSVKDIDQCSIENSYFSVGERLIYRAYYNWGLIWIPAGEVSFTVKDAGDNFEIEIIGKTYESYESIYKVYDVYRSFIDKETLAPRLFIRDVQEGSYTRYDSLSFDLENNKITSYWGRSRADATRHDFEMNDCMHDLISVLYFVRNIDYSRYEKGDMIPLDIFFDKELYPVKMEYQGTTRRKKIKGMGRQDVIEIIPEAIDGHVFDENTKMTIWASDDEYRIPLLVESPVIVGKVKGVLIKKEIPE